MKRQDHNNYLVDIIVLNYNNWRDTLVCLESLLKLKFNNFRIIVVDNGSTDNSYENISKWAEGQVEAELPSFYPLSPAVKPIQYSKISEGSANFHTEQLTILSNNQNYGYAGGNNIGIQYSIKCGTPFIWILNNDTLVTKDCLSELLKFYQETPKAGIVGSKMFYFHKPNCLQGVGGKFNKFTGTGSHIGENEKDYGKYDSANIDYPIGASVFTSKEFIERVGLMNEEYFLYYEEIDWSIRAIQHGYEIAFCPNSKIYHKEGATTGLNHTKKFKSEKADLYSLKNRIVFTKKYYRQYIPFVYMGFILVAINRIKRGQFKRLAKILKLLVKNEVVG